MQLWLKKINCYQITEKQSIKWNFHLSVFRVSFLLQTPETCENFFSPLSLFWHIACKDMASCADKSPWPRERARASEQSLHPPSHPTPPTPRCCAWGAAASPGYKKPSVTVPGAPRNLDLSGEWNHRDMISSNTSWNYKTFSIIIFKNIFNSLFLPLLF